MAIPSVPDPCPDPVTAPHSTHADPSYLTACIPLSTRWNRVTQSIQTEGTLPEPLQVSAAPEHFFRSPAEHCTPTWPNLWRIVALTRARRGSLDKAPSALFFCEMSSPVQNAWAREECVQRSIRHVMDSNQTIMPRVPAQKPTQIFFVCSFDNYIIMNVSFRNSVYAEDLGPRIHTERAGSVDS